MSSSLIRKAFASKRGFSPIVKATAPFGHPEDPGAFEEYCANTHLPLVEKIPNLQRLEAAKIVATSDGSEPAYHRVTKLYFEDREQRQGTFASDEGQAIAEDLQTFAAGGVALFLSETEE